MEGKNELRFPMDQPLSYRWSGRFVTENAAWKHMERQLIDYELMIMEKGVLFIEDEWGQYEIREGEYFLMAPTRVQRGYRASKCKFYWMHFLVTATEQDGQNGKYVTIPRRGELKNMERLFVLMKQLQDSDLRYMSPLYNDYLATAILLEIANQLKMNRTEDDAFLKRVEEYFVGHMDVAISVPMMAKDFGYHEKYFSKLFKKKTGVSVKKYIDDRKMERARYLLLNTNAYVNEIAEHLGFEDVQNFYHVFRKAANCTPSEFRRLYDGKKNEGG